MSELETNIQTLNNQDDDYYEEDEFPFIKTTVGFNTGDDDDLVEEDEDVEDEIDDADEDVENGGFVRGGNARDDVFNENDDNTEEKRNKFSDFISDDENEDDDDEDETEPNYLQKINDTMKQKIVADFHPELKSHNYNEIEIMSQTVRNEDGIIIDPLHKTMPFLTKYEKTRILGERAKQIDSGAMPFIKVEEGIIDSYIIASKELAEKKIPFIIKRPIPNGGCEYWKISDLEFLID
jgi:DNA-directed RNA polymerase I, II, and III subunit RPABC2